MKTQKIRLGILLDSDRIPAWQHCLIQQIMRSDVAELKLILIADPTDNLNLSTKPGRLYRAVARYEHRLHKAAHDACMTTNIDIMLGEFEWRHLQPEVASDLSLYKATISKEIRDHALDIIVALGAPRLIDPLSGLSKFGVWYFRHGCGQTCVADGSTVGFWEVIKNRAYVHSALTIRRPGASEQIAYESYSAVNVRSHFDCRNQHLWKIANFVTRAIRHLHNVNCDLLRVGLTDATESDTIEESARKWRLTDANLLLPLVTYVLRRLWLKLSECFRKERWILMYSLAGNTESLKDFKSITPVNGRFWADPFVLRFDRDFYIFFEDASIMTGRGHISVMRMESSGACSSPTKILERPYHLSYPFVFEWRGEIYLVPESAENRSVYNCRKKRQTG